MTDHDAIEQWHSLEQAASLLGSTPLNVLMHIKRGLLTGALLEGAWVVEPDSLTALLLKRRDGEAPVVCQSGCAKKSDGCGSCA